MTLADENERSTGRYDVDSSKLDVCPACHARNWTQAVGDLFIRDRVYCRSCGYECPKRTVTL